MNVLLFSTQGPISSIWGNIDYLVVIFFTYICKKIFDCVWKLSKSLIIIHMYMYKMKSKHDWNNVEAMRLPHAQNTTLRIAGDVSVYTARTEHGAWWHYTEERQHVNTSYSCTTSFKTDGTATGNLIKRFRRKNIFFYLDRFFCLLKHNFPPFLCM
jgi:hypothetical protein